MDIFLRERQDVGELRAIAIFMCLVLEAVLNTRTCMEPHTPCKVLGRRQGSSSIIAGNVTLKEGTEMVMPGDNVTAEFELIYPVAMEAGLRFAIREGGRTVGAGVVSKVQ